MSWKKHLTDLSVKDQWGGQPRKNVLVVGMSARKAHRELSDRSLVQPLGPRDAYRIFLCPNVEMKGWNKLIFETAGGAKSNFCRVILEETSGGVGEQQNLHSIIWDFSKRQHGYNTFLLFYICLQQTGHLHGWKGVKKEYTSKYVFQIIEQIWLRRKRTIA